MQILLIILAYLLGSFPTAYLMLKLKTGQDIRCEGSGKSGAMNTYDVSKSKVLALAVMLIDMLKGAIAVILAQILAGDALSISLSAVAAVVGHNKSAFLHFKGGRGLAVAVGLSAVINFLPVILWLAVWGISRFFTRDMDKNNISASFVSMILLFFIPAELLAWWDIFAVLPREALLIQTSLINLLVISGYINKISDKTSL